MKANFVKAALASVIALSTSSTVLAASLQDIDVPWAKDSIEKMIASGAVTGYGDNTFRPDNKITRAEFVTIINKAFNKIDNKATASFSDVSPDQWYYGQVASAKSAGYITGYSDNTFAPDKQITRQEAAEMVAKLLKLDTAKAPAAKFTDATDIPGWASGSISALAAKQILNGYDDGSFRAGDLISRAEAVVMLDKAKSVSDAPSGAQGAGSAVTGTIQAGNTAQPGTQQPQPQPQPQPAVPTASDTKNTDPASNPAYNVQPIVSATGDSNPLSSSPADVFKGTFMFIWNAKNLDNGDTTAMIQQAKKLGVTGVIIKFADGSLKGDPVSQSYMAQFKKYAGPFKAAGFKVGGWIYQYLNDVPGEVDACSQAIGAGADFIVLDGEVELQGKGARVAQFGQLLRAKYPNTLLALSSFAIADYHPEVPFAEYSKFVDAMMPQIYWDDMGWTVDKAFNASVASYKRFGKPIAPTGQSYATAQPGDIARFIQLSQNAKFTNVSWWDWDEANQGQLAAIQGNPLALPPNS